MTIPETSAPLTPKGLATRQRIVESAAELLFRNGVQGTTNPAVRGAAGVSGSQLSHYFPEKENLVRAVLDWRAEQVVSLSRATPTGRLDSIDALRSWAASYTANDRMWRGGCRFGSLASEVLKSGLHLGDDVASGFRGWLAVFREGITAMRDDGVLRDDADPDRLATVLLAAFQGGMLLAQAEDSVTPLRLALESAVDYVESFR